MDCTVNVNDCSISKVHASVEYSEDLGWVISDGNITGKSANGVWRYIGQDKIIKDSMIFKAGRTVFQLNLL